MVRERSAFGSIRKLTSVGTRASTPGLLEFGQVVRVDQHDDRTAIPGQCHALVVELYAIDKFTEMFADRI